jgi:hypothetical protein
LLGARPRQPTIGVIVAGSGLPSLALSMGLALELADRGRTVAVVGRVDRAERGSAAERVPGLSGRRHVRIVPLTVAGPGGGTLEPAKFVALLEAAREGGEILLVEPPGEGLEVSLAAQDLVLACGAQPAALMSSYRLLKRMAQAGGRARTQVLVCGAPTDAAAGRLFANLSDTASRFLALRLDYVGHLRDGAHLLEAGRLQQPVSAVHPESPCGALLARCIHALLYPGAD